MKINMLPEKNVSLSMLATYAVPYWTFLIAEGTITADCTSRHLYNLCARKAQEMKITFA